MIKLFASIVFFAISLFASQSCYDMYKLEQKPEQSIETALFILIDETTLFDETLKQQVWDNALRHLKQGNYVYVAKFSAFINQSYNKKVFEFTLDRPLSEKEKYNERKDTLTKLDKCLKDEYVFVGTNTQKAINESFGTPANTIAKSDIFYALNDFGLNAIKEVKAKRKIVILASDMLENSSISSFYANNAVRQIVPNDELKKVQNNNLLSDFGGAEIYIIGAGTIAPVKGDTYRDPKKLNALKSFWEEYFKQSNAKLVEMGQPALKRVIE